MGRAAKQQMIIDRHARIAEAHRSNADLVVVTVSGLALVGLAWDGLDGLMMGLVGWAPRQSDVLAVVVLGMIVVCLGYFSFRFYRAGRAATLTAAERSLLAEIDRGIRHGEFVPYFQPIYDAEAGRIVAAEALVRWVGHDGGVRMPAEFIPLMEKVGWLSRITGNMVAGAAAAVRRAAETGQAIQVSVNVSAQDFENLDLVREVEEACRREGVATDRLKIELTETQSLRQVELARDVAEALNARGVSVVLDDFGTGYASMHVLDLLPFSQIKLDRFFVKGLHDDPVARAIVKASVDLASALGADVVAEGIEDANTAARLHAMGIHLMQGFHYGPPMPLPDLVLRLTDPQWRIVAARNIRFAALA